MGIILKLYGYNKKILFFIPVIPFIIILLIYQLDSTLPIYPNDDINCILTTYCDGGENGNSVISEPVVKDSVVSFEYTLRKGHAYPYAGISVDLIINNIFLDISKYNYLTLKLTSDKVESYKVYLKTFIEGFTDLDDIFTYKFLMKEVSTDRTSPQYRIYLREFNVPSWWLAEKKVLETDNQIDTLAYSVEYNNMPHFNRTFKQFERITPKEYRRKHRTVKSS